MKLLADALSTLRHHAEQITAQGGGEKTPTTLSKTVRGINNVIICTKRHRSASTARPCPCCRPPQPAAPGGRQMADDSALPRPAGGERQGIPTAERPERPPGPRKPPCSAGRPVPSAPFRPAVPEGLGASPPRSPRGACSAGKPAGGRAGRRRESSSSSSSSGPGRGDRGGKASPGGGSAPGHPEGGRGGVLRRRPLAVSGRGRGSVPVTAACARDWRRFPPRGRREEGRETRFPPYPGRAPSRRRHFTLPAPAAGPPPSSSSPLASPPLGPGWEGGARGKGGGTRPPSPRCLVGNCRAEPERPVPLRSRPLLLLPPQQNGGAWSHWEPVSDSASPPRRRRYRRRHSLICIDQPPHPPPPPDPRPAPASPPPSPSLPIPSRPLLPLPPRLTPAPAPINHQSAAPSGSINGREEAAAAAAAVNEQCVRAAPSCWRC